MRRRQPDIAAVGSGLTVDALRLRPDDDLTLSPALRVQIFEDWVADRRDWVARREAHEERHGWPGGTWGRVTEEDEAHPVGDAPFDPQAI